MDVKQAKALRDPFPASAIGKLPKGGVMLDFVGHAATTDRLLAVDPEWSWEPFAVDDHGLPALDRSGNLWIRLTVCGVTRIGVGDGKSAKEVIGDAIRNAAMRFGVALDLWAKEDLHGISQAGASAPVSTEPTPNRSPAEKRAMGRSGTAPITDAQMKKMHATFNDAGITDREARLDFTRDAIGDLAIQSSTELSKTQAGLVIDALDRLVSDLYASHEEEPPL